MLQNKSQISVTPEVQLAYVLPIESLHLIPNNIGVRGFEGGNANIIQINIKYNGRFVDICGKVIWSYLILI